MDRSRKNGPAREKLLQFLNYLVPTAEKFFHNQKFLLGDCIQTAALDG